MDHAYHAGLLYLIHLLMGVDGDINETELVALRKVRDHEKIPDPLYFEFESNVRTLRERELYHRGIGFINQCSRDEKLSIFATLYKMSEVDGRVHQKEIKLLLYSIESAGIEFDEVVNAAKARPNYF
ncbi:MAG TPA: hypothetical protein VKZ86_07555 [Cyclobacteriaceae bacterium]|nr:hypothetical protein [Cyclobacteriaceae bacterium]